MFGDDAYLTVCVTTDEGVTPANGIFATLDLLGGMSGSGSTYNDGCFSTYIPANEQMVLTLFSSCGEELLSTAVGPFSTNSEPTISFNIDNSIVTTTIIGTMVDCYSTPVSGDVYMTGQNANGGLEILSAEIQLDGSFEIVNYGCLTDLSEVSLYDNGLYYTLDINTTVTSGVINDIGELTTCGADYEYFFQTIDGVMSSDNFAELYGLNQPVWSFFSETQLTFENTGMIGTANMVDSLGNAGWIYDWNSGEVYSAESSNYTVNITEYPAMSGEYLEGTITGQSESPDNPGVWVPILLEFRLQANQ